MTAKKESGKIIVYTDGGSRGNPGPSALGVYFEATGKKYSQFLGKKTNNEAEYQAITFALKKCRQLFGSRKVLEMEVEIRSDSDLIVNQLSGLFKLKEEHLWKYFIDIWNLKQDFGKVIFTHIPREKNKIADRLVNEELDTHLPSRLDI